METDREGLSLKEVLDQLDSHISGFIMSRELLCRIKDGRGR